MNKIILISSFLLLGWISWSQTKNEHEERVKLEALPEVAVAVVNTLPKKHKRLRFYQETDGDKRSFEAKFKYEKQHYSLEFSADGVIEDIEVIIMPDQIKTCTKYQIDDYFKRTFEKSKLIKVQIQYVYNGSENAIKFVNQVLSKNGDLNINYEVIAEVKTETERKVGEFLFNANGALISFKTLNPNSYEHALY